MKKILTLLAAGILLVSILPGKATLICYGVFYGTVTGSSGGPFNYSVGTPVSGTFRYDINLLSADAFGNLHTGYDDPNASYYININGQGFIGYAALFSGLNFTVDANGFPVSGSAAGSMDLGIGRGGVMGVGSDVIGSHISTQVTYQVTGIPDTGGTASLLGIALAGMSFTRRRFRLQIKDAA